MLSRGILRRFYTRNPLESRTMEELKGAVSGGRGGRGGRGRKKGGKKGFKDTSAIVFGEGKRGIRWSGLSSPMTNKRLRYGFDWLKELQLGINKSPSEMPGSPKVLNSLFPAELEGQKRVKRRVSEMYWGRPGWTGTKYTGRSVGCPELPDGTPVTSFSSVVIELKRVANQTKAGKKRTVSALVVVGNGRGAAAFAVGKADEIKAAIRKAKNRAINYLYFIPRCEDSTIYHNVEVKYCRTKILMERSVKGSGLKCQRAVSMVCQLAGIKDMRAKIVGSTNPLNVIRATFRGLTSQETYQQLADKSGLFVVEYNREQRYRPKVVAIPEAQNTAEVKEELTALQLL